jgi:hypothetical protein
MDYHGTPADEKETKEGDAAKQEWQMVIQCSSQIYLRKKPSTTKQ